MKLLIRKFTRSHEQTEDDYAELLFEPIGATPSTITSCQLIEPPVTTEDLCDLVKATSYLSFQEYWETSKEIRLLSTISTLELATTNDLIADLYSSKKPNNEIFNETEVDYYFRELVEKIDCNFLVW
ncbi:8622_t:CDS:2 [Scutellospora calospora]|uniref:8622_t:CDS:1 n=1 Tax=Scutellospora calospora TaxID=85575 RepID=A0ACA9LAH5_9GLOM|nr:8622_t:CDS:2 [Scutellospora calospora]